MKIKALIPVKSGSQRVSNKNIRPFAGSTLLDIKIQTLLNVKELNGIVVNSNSDEMLEIASKYGVEIVKREERYATNEVSMSDVYVNMAENFDGDTILFTQVTSPLLKVETISKMIKNTKRLKDMIPLILRIYLKNFIDNHCSPNMNFRNLLKFINKLYDKNKKRMGESSLAFNQK